MHANIYTGPTLVMMPRWDRDLVGWLISTAGQHLDQHPHHGDRPAGEPPNFGRLRPLQPVHIGGGGAMPQAWRQRLRSSTACAKWKATASPRRAPSHSNPPDAPKQQCLGIPS
jgi:fatty-acyl-CoA synthase